LDETLLFGLGELILAARFFNQVIPHRKHLVLLSSTEEIDD
jgi:hypothetical protein